MIDDNCPSLSVILVIGNQRKRAKRALDSILSQSKGNGIEILLIDCTEDSVPPVEGSEDPVVRLNRLKKSVSYNEARAIGVSMAKAPIVVFIEEHTIVLEQWSCAILNCFQQNPWDGVGYEIHNGNPSVGISDVAYLMNYVRWSPPASPGETDLIPGHNTAYRRDVLLSYGEHLPELLANDIVMQRRLIKDGYRLGMEPRARAMHYNEGAFILMGKVHYYFNRCLGAYRDRFFKISGWQKMLFLLTLPIRPWLRFADNLLFILIHRPRYFARYLSNGAYIIASSYFSVAGIVMGLFFGPGNAVEKLSDHELNADRPLV